MSLNKIDIFKAKKRNTNALSKDNIPAISINISGQSQLLLAQLSIIAVSEKLIDR